MRGKKSFFSYHIVIIIFEFVNSFVYQLTNNGTTLPKEKISKNNILVENYYIKINVTVMGITRRCFCKLRIINIEVLKKKQVRNIRTKRVRY